MPSLIIWSSMLFMSNPSDPSAFSSLSKILGCVIITVLLVMTVHRNYVWRSKISLWEDTVGKSPNKLRPHLQLGSAYREKGMSQLAMKEYLTVLRLCSTDSNADRPAHDGISECGQAQFNISSIFIDYGDLDSAHELLIDLVGRYDSPIFKSNLGIISLKLGKYEEAVEYLKQSDPANENVDIQFRLAEGYRLMGDCERAKEFYGVVGKWNKTIKMPECKERAK